MGCWIAANTALGRLPQDSIYWHLDVYPTRAEADAAKGPRGTVLAAFGKVWLLGRSTWLDGAPAWRRVSEIGPLPASPATTHSAPEGVCAGMTALHIATWTRRTAPGETCPNARRKDGRPRGWLRRDRTRRPTNAPDRHRHGNPPCPGLDPARCNQAANNTGARLDSQGIVSIMNVAAPLAQRFFAPRCFPTIDGDCAPLADRMSEALVRAGNRRRTLRPCPCRVTGDASVTRRTVSRC